MSGIKIGSGGGLPPPPPEGLKNGDGPKGACSGPDGAERLDRPAARFDPSAVGSPEAASPVAEAARTSCPEPADLVRLLREGAIGIEEAVERLAERAMAGRLVAGAPEPVRQQIRETLAELARHDPTLSGLVQALKR